MFYNFIIKEFYIFKLGDVDYEGCVGVLVFWLSILDEKCEVGEILYDLQIMENRVLQVYKVYIFLFIL